MPAIRPTSSAVLLASFLTLALGACFGSGSIDADPQASERVPNPEVAAKDLKALSQAEVEDKGLARATFAGGCFWCMEPPFDKIKGVEATLSGYIGGQVDHPTYKEVSAGRTRYTEAVQVVYDPEKISYDELLKTFWRNIDPTVANKQFCDWGSQYRTGVFYHGDTQRKAAEASKQAIVDSRRFDKVVTEITEAGAFYLAESYHQNYYKKNAAHYNRYRRGCGRDARLHELWGE